MKSCNNGDLDVDISLWMIDRLFDTMNGLNPCANGFKAPLNWMERKAFLSRVREYLLTLVTKDVFRIR